MLPPNFQGIHHRVAWSTGHAIFGENSSAASPRVRAFSYQKNIMKKLIEGNSSPQFINPVDVARKLQAARNLENPWLSEPLKQNPHLAEMSWFVQYQSFQPGGLDQFVEDLLEANPDKFIPVEMATMGPAIEGRYSLEQCCAAWNYIWDTQRRLWPRYRRNDPEVQSFCEWLEFNCDGCITAERVNKSPSPAKAKMLEGFERFNWPFLSRVFADLARECLPDYLKRFCTDHRGWEYARLVPWIRQEVPCGPIYCPELTDVLLDYMKVYAERVKKKLAMTEVAIMVFDALDSAWSLKMFVRIDGNTRFGKSEAVKIWCAMYPGRARYVRTPSQNPLIDLVNKIAKALGTRLWPDDVQTVLEEGSLGWFFDEAHYLFPVRFTELTVPHRWNYVREHIVEPRSPCAIITTPQSYDGQMEKFKKTTSYSIGQIEGRVNRHIRLPEKLKEHDLELVARIHFPELEGPRLAMVVNAALLAPSFLQSMENIAKLSRWNADKRKSAKVTFEDIRLAILEVAPNIANEMEAPLGLQSPSPTPDEGTKDCAPPKKTKRVKRKETSDDLETLGPDGKNEDSAHGPNAEPPPS
jgi:hypothetical protein